MVDVRPSPVFPASMALVADRVEERVLALLDEEIRRWGSVDSDLVTPLESLRALVVAGGKRLRPAFCYCAFVGAGGAPDDPVVIDVAAAIELVHTFALIHDDVMDGSDMRRGLDAVHRQFAILHDNEGWRGEHRRFGDGMAILIGDFALVYADVLARTAPREALDVFDQLRVELCVGQSLDLVGTARASVESDTARKIATYKSAKYTVERPMHLGAALAGRLDELRESLSSVGVPLGEAFQLRDDVLGVFGDSVHTGKPVGDDLREGKATPLVAITAARATGDDAALLGRLGAADVDETEVKALQDLFVRTGALAEVERAIEALVGEALRALEHLDVRADAAQRLSELAAYVAWRDR